MMFALSFSCSRSDRGTSPDESSEGRCSGLMAKLLHACGQQVSLCHLTWNTVLRMLVWQAGSKASRQLQADV